MTKYEFPTSTSHVVFEETPSWSTKSLLSSYTWRGKWGKLTVYLNHI